jgi:deoxyribose-phosphate aldolase
MVQIKAAGGVRTLDDLLAVRELGVSRIGATATQKMLDEAIARGYPGSLPNPRASQSAAHSGY